MFASVYQRVGETAPAGDGNSDAGAVSKHFAACGQRNVNAGGHQVFRCGGPDACSRCSWTPAVLQPCVDLRIEARALTGHILGTPALV
jgi:hypothetical protein